LWSFDNLFKIDFEKYFMKINKYIINKAVKKAMSSMCNYKISALGFNNKGELICSSFNKPRFHRQGGGVHAEMNVMAKAGPGLKTVLICRVNAHGKLLPIDPCKFCAEKAKELGIKIVTICEA
jgi:deoxycytidylate deaminase